MKTSHKIMLALGLSSSLLHAQGVPQSMAYQGRLTDSAGVGIGTGTPENRKVIFRIFDHPTAGNRLWAEEQTITISNGEFSVLLGQGIDAIYAGAQEFPRPSLGSVFSSHGTMRYLEIVVDNGDNTLNSADTPITPRQQLTTTAYAFRAESLASPSGNIAPPTNDSGGLGMRLTLWPGAVNSTPFGMGMADNTMFSVVPNTSIHSWYGGTSEIMRLNGGTGQLGLGTTTPQGKMEIYEAIGTPRQTNAGTLVLNHGNAGGASSIVFQSAANRGSDYAWIQYQDNAGSGENSILSIGAENEGDDAIALMPSGNVGIGTYFPTDKLHVVGNGRVQGKFHINDGGVGAPNANAFGGNGGRICLWQDPGQVPFGLGIESSKMWHSVPNGGSFNWYSGTNPTMGLSGSGALYLSNGVHLYGSTGINSSVTAQGNYMAFGHIGVSEDFLSYANNAFYLHDSPGGGDVTHPNLWVGGTIFANNATQSLSDQRMKRIVGQSDGASDLATLNAIEITDFTWLDPAQTQAPQKKVIAQQVQKVFPQAVVSMDSQTNILPDIMKQAKVKDGWIMLSTDLKKGEKVQLLGQIKQSSEIAATTDPAARKYCDGVYEVLEVEKNRFRTNMTDSVEEVKVHGRQVKDLLTVDYDALAMLNISATQQLKKEKDSEIKTLREENASLRASLAAQEKRLATLEKALSGGATQPTADKKADRQ